MPSIPRQQNFITELPCLQFSYMILHFNKAILKLNPIKMYKYNLLSYMKETWNLTSYQVLLLMPSKQ